MNILGFRAITARLRVSAQRDPSDAPSDARATPRATSQALIYHWRPNLLLLLAVLLTTSITTTTTILLLLLPRYTTNGLPRSCAGATRASSRDVWLLLHGRTPQKCGPPPLCESRHMYRHHTNRINDTTPCEISSRCLAKSLHTKHESIRRPFQKLQLWRRGCKGNDRIAMTPTRVLHGLRT